MMISAMLISDIEICNRTRKDYGNLEGLAKSIERTGLLNPVLIDQDNKLIDGERRIKAHQLLKRDNIEIRVIDVPSLIVAENDANEFAKQWTPSERVAIAKAIADEEKNRAKERQREAGEQFGKGIAGGHLTASYETGKSRDIIAKKAGFSSEGTMRRAAKVVEDGIHDVQEAMDKQDISINQACQIASQPKETQKEALAEAVKPKSERKKHSQKKPQFDQSRLYANGSPISARSAYFRVEKEIETMGKDDPNTIPMIHKIIDICRAKLDRLAGDQK